MSLKLIISNEILGISFEECAPTIVELEVSIKIESKNPFKDLGRIIAFDHNTLEEWDLIVNDI